MQKTQNFNGIIEKLTPNEMDFVRTLIQNGYDLTTSLALVGKTLKVSTVANIQNTPTVSNKSETVSNSNSTKSRKGGKKGASKRSNKSSTKGSKKNNKPAELKVNDYFKVVSTKGNKIVAIGVVKEVAADKITATNGRSYVPANCVAITKATYGKLSARKKLAKCLVNKPEVSEADKFKRGCMLVLHKNGKINDSDFKLSLDNAEKRSELYKEFKEYLKANKELVKQVVEAKAETEQAKA